MPASFALFINDFAIYRYVFTQSLGAINKIVGFLRKAILGEVPALYVSRTNT